MSVNDVISLWVEGFEDSLSENTTKPLYRGKGFKMHQNDIISGRLLDVYNVLRSNKTSCTRIADAIFCLIEGLGFVSLFSESLDRSRSTE